MDKHVKKNNTKKASLYLLLSLLFLECVQRSFLNKHTTVYEFPVLGTLVIIAEGSAT